MKTLAPIVAAFALCGAFSCSNVDGDQDGLRTGTGGGVDLGGADVDTYEGPCTYLHVEAEPAHVYAPDLTPGTYYEYEIEVVAPANLWREVIVYRTDASGSLEVVSAEPTEPAYVPPGEGYTYRTGYQIRDFDYCGGDPPCEVELVRFNYQTGCGPTGYEIVKLHLGEAAP